MKLTRTAALERLAEVIPRPPSCRRVRQEWDELTWPRASRDCYRVKTAIPGILRDLSLG